MAYVPVIVCLEALSDLNAAFAPFDRCQSVPVYRAYETGHPSKHWAVDQLRKQTRLSPDGTTLTWAPPDRPTVSGKLSVISMSGEPVLPVTEISDDLQLAAEGVDAGA
jgi:hypothetical protein